MITIGHHNHGNDGADSCAGSGSDLDSRITREQEAKTLRVRAKEKKGEEKVDRDHGNGCGLKCESRRLVRTQSAATAAQQ